MVARGSPTPSAAASATTYPSSARSRSTCRLREGGDVGKPIVESDPTAPGAVVLTEIARALAGRGRGLAGMQLGSEPDAEGLSRCSGSVFRSWR